MKELFLDFYEYDGYKISNFGNLLNKRNNPVLGSLDSDGYRRFTMYKNGKMKYIPCHRIVAKTFIPNPNNLPQVNHIDGNKLNNSVENLEWCTAKDNVIHSYRTGLKIGAKPNLGRFGIKSNRHNECIQISKDGFIIGQYGSMLEAQRETGVASGSICRTIKGELKTAGGYIWK